MRFTEQEAVTDEKMTDMLGSSISSASWEPAARGSDGHGRRDSLRKSSSWRREKRLSNRRLFLDAPVMVPSFISTQQEGDDNTDEQELLLRQRRVLLPPEATTNFTPPKEARKRRLRRLQSCLSNFRVRIRSGRKTEEDDPWFEIPSEPLTPPPLPTNIARFVVLGDVRVGKTSLIQSFLHHERVQLEDSLVWLEETGTEESASSTQDSKGHWSVSYHKKDVAYWLGRGDRAGCCRVQLYDVSGSPSAAPSQTVNQLVVKATTIFLAVSAESDWKELSASVRTWMEWLGRRQQQTQKDQPKTRSPTDLRVLLVLTKCDLLHPDITSAASFVRLGQDLTALCQELDILSCHFVSSIDEDDDDDDEWKTGEEVLIDELKQVARTPISEATVVEEASIVSMGSAPASRDGTRYSRASSTSAIHAKAIPM